MRSWTNPSPSNLSELDGANLHCALDSGCEPVGVLPGPQTRLQRAACDLHCRKRRHCPCASLDAFEASELGQKYPQSVKVWRDAWERFVPFPQFLPAGRKCSTPPIRLSRLTLKLRKAPRNRGLFPNDTAALKTLWLMICNIEDKRAAQCSK